MSKFLDRVKMYIQFVDEMKQTIEPIDVDDQDVHDMGIINKG